MLCNKSACQWRNYQGRNSHTCDWALAFHLCGGRPWAPSPPSVGPAAAAGSEQWPGSPSHTVVVVHCRVSLPTTSHYRQRWWESGQCTVSTHCYGHSTPPIPPSRSMTGGGNCSGGESQLTDQSTEGGGALCFVRRCADRVPTLEALRVQTNSTEQGGRIDWH